MVFQPQDPQQGRIRRIGINPGRHDLHDHAVFQLGLGKIPDRPVDDPGPAEQEMQCPRIDIRFRQRLAAPAAGIVDDILVHAAAQRGERKFPHFIADFVRAGKIAAAAEFRGGGGEAQHRNDRTRGFPHRDHDISGSARHQPHPGIVPVLQDQGIGHPAQRADGPHRIAGEMQPAGDVHDIPRGTVQVQDREPVAEFLQVIDCELALMQPRDPTLPFHGEFAIRKEGGYVVEIFIQRQQADRIFPVIHRKRGGGKRERDAERSADPPTGKRLHRSLPPEHQAPFRDLREEQQHSHRFGRDLLKTEEPVPSRLQMDGETLQHFVADPRGIGLFIKVQLPGLAPECHRIVVAEHRERIVGRNIHADRGFFGTAGIDLRGIIARQDLLEIVIGIERRRTDIGVSAAVKRFERLRFRPQERRNAREDRTGVASRISFQDPRIFPLFVVIAVHIPAGQLTVQIDLFHLVHAVMAARLILQIAIRFMDFPVLAGGDHRHILISGSQTAPDLRRMRMRMPAAVIPVHHHQPQRVDPRGQILRHIVTVHIAFRMGGSGRTVADMFAVEIDVIERQCGYLQLKNICIRRRDEFPTEKYSAVIPAVCIGKPDPAPLFRFLCSLSAKHDFPFQNDSEDKNSLCGEL